MIRLWRIRFSTNVERVTLALARKGLEAESVWIEPDNRDPLIELSGQPLVPVLEDDSRVVADSTKILEYLEERYPDPPLYPTEPTANAEMRLFIDWFNRVWKVAPNAIESELAKEQPDHDRIGALGREMTTHLDLLAALLDRREFLLGPHFSAADAIAFPFLKYALMRDAEDTETFHEILEEQQPLEPRHLMLAAWIRRVDDLPRSPADDAPN